MNTTLVNQYLQNNASQTVANAWAYFKSANTIYTTIKIDVIPPTSIPSQQHRHIPSTRRSTSRSNTPTTPYTSLLQQNSNDDNKDDNKDNDDNDDDNDVTMHPGSCGMYYIFKIFSNSINFLYLNKSSELTRMSSKWYKNRTTVVTLADIGKMFATGCYLSRKGKIRITIKEKDARSFFFKLVNAGI